MKYIFTGNDNVHFELHETFPQKKNHKINTSALTLFGIYRNSIYKSYSNNLELDQDIKDFNEASVHIENNRIIDRNDPVNNYAIYGSLSAIKELLENKAKCYIAYKDDNNPIMIGFVSFKELTINEKSIVYISNACVRNEYQRNGIGYRLMQCVLMHYPAETEFYILTRKFNASAIKLYQERLKFSTISSDEVKLLGYDQRYIGFKCKTTKDELNKIEADRAAAPMHSKQKYK